MINAVFNFQNQEKKYTIVPDNLVQLSNLCDLLVTQPFKNVSEKENDKMFDALYEQTQAETNKIGCELFKLNPEEYDVEAHIVADEDKEIGVELSICIYKIQPFDVEAFMNN
jgi:hypothetical protein